MKANYVGNVDLQKLAEASPPRAHIILQTAVVTASDVKDTQADWDGADSVANFTTLQSGGARPTGAEATKVEYATGTDDAITSMPGVTGSPLPLVTIEWNTALDTAIEGINSFTARLDPDASGGGATVTHWRAQLWRVARVNTDTGERSEGEHWDIEPTSNAVVVAAGASVSEVEFIFAGVLPQIGQPPVFVDNSLVDSVLRGWPTTVIIIEALQGNGVIDTNVAWIGNNSLATATDNDHHMTRWDATQTENQSATERFSRLLVASNTNGLPRFSIKGRTFSSRTITFSQVGNRIDLGAAPTGTVEFVCDGDEPGGSAITYQARAVNGSTTWTAVTDGDLDTDVGLTGTTGGEYLMQAIVAPNNAGTVTATVRRLGAREVTRENVPGVARVDNPTYALDPRTFKAQIPTLSIAFDREIRDYRDFTSELFSDNHAGSIEFRVFYGSTSLARQHWLHLDDYRLDNYDSATDPVVVRCIHPLALTKQTIPVASTGGQSALVYSGSSDTTQSVYANLLATAGIAGRYRGVLLGTTNTKKIAKTIAQQRPMKDELDRVAFIEGGAVVPSAGRLKWKRIFTTTGGFAPDAAEVTHFEDVEPLSVSPHLDLRVISFRAPYGWNQRLDEGNGGYAGQVWQSSTSATSKLGHAALGSHQDLEDETARWLISDSTSVGSVYGAAIASRTVRSLKSGMLVIRFRAEQPHPWVELGDPVSVPTDRFIGRGIETDVAIRGQGTFFGTVIEHDLLGTEFAVWVPEIEGFLPAQNNIAIDYGRRPAANALHTGSTDRPSNSTTPTVLQSVTVPAHYIGDDGTLKLTANWAIAGTSAAKSAWFTFGGQTLNAVSWLAGETQRAELECVVTNIGSAAAQRVSSRVIGGSTSTPPKPAPTSLTIDTSVPVVVGFVGDLTSTGDTITLEFSRVEHLG